MTTCYDAAPRPCATGASVGARNLMRAIEDQPELDAHTSLGIFNCRNQNRPGGSSSPSVHGNGRAGDSGLPVINGRPHQQGGVLALVLQWIGSHHPDVGLQFVIWNRRKIGCQWAWASWEPYGGYAHTDHVHWELTRAGAATLTYAHAVEVLNRAFVALGYRQPTPLNPEDEPMEVTLSSYMPEHILWLGVRRKVLLYGEAATVRFAGWDADNTGDPLESYDENVVVVTGRTKVVEVPDGLDFVRLSVVAGGPVGARAAE